MTPTRILLALALVAAAVLVACGKRCKSLDLRHPIPHECREYCGSYGDGITACGKVTKEPKR